MGEGWKQMKRGRNRVMKRGGDRTRKNEGREKQQKRTTIQEGIRKRQVKKKETKTQGKRYQCPREKLESKIVGAQKQKRE